ncbi:helix-turn-helix domain-containing protein [Spongiibacter marinus]|uniref:helix-turn-helix domain-containing protein n=1 Tax=Spongiibacter marinus TaxID=354246 RepID=UPI000481E4C8|nr:helix-turn-helix transcriptional regulator [Spongiibacter marinus]
MPTPHHISPGVKRTLLVLGKDLKEARLRRRLTAEVVAERAGISRPTLRRVEAGNEGVSMGIYASVMQAVGLLDNLKGVADISNDAVGRAIIGEQLTPQRAKRKSKE